MQRLAGRTIYHLHALAAAGVAPTNPDVDATVPVDRGLARLEPWLDHVAALGAGAVLLTPVFASSTHGYDTVDPFVLDPRLGDEADVDRFVAACHERDLLVLFDGVFNHVGRAFPRFVDVVRDGPASPSARWFRIDPAGDDGDGFGYATFEGHRELPSLDHGEPEVLDWAAAVIDHWSDRGVDGWRFDAAYAIPRPFLAALVDRVRSTHPDLFLFGEVIHGDYAGFVDETGLDSVTQYELYKAIWSSLLDANPHELAWALSRHRAMLDTFTPVTFVGNHDVTRIASRLAGTDRLVAAVALLFALPGIPCIYYGDELGWTGVKEDRAGGDDAIRPPLPPLPPVEAVPGIFTAHAALVALRRARPWLTTADVTVDEVTSTRLALSATARDGSASLHTVVDLADPAPGVPLGSRRLVDGGTGAEVFRALHVVLVETVPDARGRADG